MAAEATDSCIDKAKRVLKEVCEQRLNLQSHIDWLLHEKRNVEFSKLIDDVMEEGDAIEIVRVKQMVRQQIKDMEADILKMVAIDQTPLVPEDEKFPPEASQLRDIRVSYPKKKDKVDAQASPRWLKSTISSAAKFKRQPQSNVNKRLDVEVPMKAEKPYTVLKTIPASKGYEESLAGDLQEEAEFDPILLTTTEQQPSAFSKSKDNYEGVYFSSAIPLGPPVQKITQIVPEIPDLPKEKEKASKSPKKRKNVSLLTVESGLKDPLVHKGRHLIKQALPSVDITSHQAASRKPPRKNIQFVTITAPSQEKITVPTATVGTNTLEPLKLDKATQEEMSYETPKDSVQAVINGNDKESSKAVSPNSSTKEVLVQENKLPEGMLSHTLINEIAVELKEKLLSRLLQDSELQANVKEARLIPKMQDKGEQLDENNENHDEDATEVELNEDAQDGMENDEGTESVGKVEMEEKSQITEVKTVVDRVNKEVQVSICLEEEEFVRETSSKDKSDASQKISSKTKTPSPNEPSAAKDETDVDLSSDAKSSAPQIETNTVEIQTSLKTITSDKETQVEESNKVSSEQVSYTDTSIQVPSTPSTPHVKEDVSIQVSPLSSSQHTTEVIDAQLQVTPSLWSPYMQDISVQMSPAVQHNTSASDLTAISASMTSGTDEHLSDGEFLLPRPMLLPSQREPLYLGGIWRQPASPIGRVELDHTLADMADLDIDDMDITLSEGEVPQHTKQLHQKEVPHNGYPEQSSQDSESYSAGEVTPGIYYHGIRKDDQESSSHIEQNSSNDQLD